MRVLIMAGGTGGHVFPAIAIAKALQAQGAQILWLGTRGRMEEKLVPKYGFEISYSDVKGIRGNGLLIKLKAPFMLLHSLFQALKVIKNFKPDVALGMGGYASGPGGVAAKLLGVPLCLHEQNAAAGLTNRLLSKIADKIMLGFKGAFEGPKVQVCGNPVRDEILKCHGLAHNFKQDGILHILVVGGSLGAKFLNDNLPLFFKEISKTCNFKFAVFHQCGSSNAKSVSDLYAGATFPFVAQDFIDDMKEAYQKADLIICRAGALTVAELCCVGVPAIFVPLPTAVDDHQTKNARTIEEAGGAFVALQKDLDAKLLASLLSKMQDKDTLVKMSKSLYQKAHLNATQDVVLALHSLCAEKK